MTRKKIKKNKKKTLIIALVMMLVIISIISVIIGQKDTYTSAKLTEGLYKASDVNILSDTEDSKFAEYNWFNLNGIAGNGWDYVNYVNNTKDGGIIAVGEFSYYSSSAVTGETSGVDLNQDGTAEVTSIGRKDGIIISYDEKGNYKWSKTFGGSDDDALNKIIQTSDGGYVAVGYVSSDTVYYDDSEITELAKTDSLGYKDAVILKLDNNGDYLWGIRFGGTSNDEITAVTETSDNQIVVVGNFYSDTMNFYENNGSVIIRSFTNTNDSNGNMYQTGMSGFIASYSLTGEYKWSQRIAGDYDVEVVDVIATQNGVAAAVNHISTVYLNTAYSASQIGASTSYTNGTVVEYNLSGNYTWRYRFYPSEESNNVEISSLALDNDNNIIAAVEFKRSAGLLGSLDAETATTVVATGSVSTYYDATLVKLGSNGTYSRTIYLFSGNYDDYISDVKVTEDGGIVLGGWYYSTDGIDVDNNGNTTGIYDIDAVSGTYTSDGFMIKLDAEYNVVASSRFYGSGYDGVTSVVGTESGYIVSAGFSSSSTLTASSYKAMEEQESEVEIIRTIDVEGNVDGFIAVEGTIVAEVGFSFTTVAEEDYKLALEGVEFALYRLKDETSSEKDDLIDIDNPASCWTLVGKYTSSDLGEVSFEDLPITSEYRLVETKTVENRMIPSGQWKIEFMYGDYDKESDTSIITVNGVDMKITAIGNPPAFIYTKDAEDTGNGTLLLPNSNYFEIPISGAVGVYGIYQFATIILLSGLILLIGRKLLYIKHTSKRTKLRNKNLRLRRNNRIKR